MSAIVPHISLYSSAAKHEDRQQIQSGISDDGWVTDTPSYKKMINFSSCDLYKGPMLQASVFIYKSIMDFIRYVNPT